MRAPRRVVGPRELPNGGGAPWAARATGSGWRTRRRAGAPGGVAQLQRAHAHRGRCATDRARVAVLQDVRRARQDPGGDHDERGEGQPHAHLRAHEREGVFRPRRERVPALRAAARARGDRARRRVGGLRGEGYVGRAQAGRPRRHLEAHARPGRVPSLGAKPASGRRSADHQPHGRHGHHNLRALRRWRAKQSRASRRASGTSARQRA